MRNPDRETVFHFKSFDVSNRRSAMKVGTDGVLLGAWAAADFSPAGILDVGCGTGVISMILAQRFPQAKITGIDISPDAVGESAGNFAASPWPGRLSALEADFKDFAASGSGFDLIVSNPPFFENGALAPDADRQRARHEDSLPLQSLISGAAGLLNPGGILSLILPADREGKLLFEATLAGFHPIRLDRVVTTPSKPARRILAEFMFRPGNMVPTRRKTITIRQSDGTPGERYASLVKDFYLRF